MFPKTIARVSSNAIRISKRLTHQTGSEGATASSKGGFGDKEKAIENQWARLHDAEKLQKLRDQMKENETLKKKLEQLENNK